METAKAYIETPIGIAEITGNSEGINAITIIEDTVSLTATIPTVLQKCATQLQEYFAGTRTEFSVKLNPKGTEFQKKVWKALLEIPAGKTKSYLEQSKALGDPKAIRAVASANGKNPIWILIPCHRIIGTDGSLTGYAGGIWRKKWLLNHESQNKQQSLF